MKKFCTTLLMLCITVMCAFAGSDIKVMEGNKKFFKSAQGEALLTINWGQATYDYKKPLTEKFGDLEPYADASYSGFIDSFNDECKKVKIVPGSKNAKYQFTIDVTNVDQYIKVMGFVPGPATKIWGTLTITDIATGEKLLVVDIKSVDGGASPSPFESFSDSFEELAEQVADLK